MYCRECGFKVSPYDTTCPNCYNHVLEGKKFCHHCANQTNEKDTFCQSCGSEFKSVPTKAEVTNVRQSNTYQSDDYSSHNNNKVKTVYVTRTVVDEPNDLANIASFCCWNPIVGIILYLVWMNEKPRAAESVCHWTIAGFIFSIIFGFIYAFLGK